VNHGFLRASDGAFTTFDAPGAQGTKAGTGFGGDPVINPAEAITGTYFTGNFPAVAVHGFLRAPHGTFTTFDAPGARSTVPFGINPAGVITGNYVDAGNVTHGFLRIPHGTK
jgi:hypothetical protein